MTVEEARAIVGAPPDAGYPDRTRGAAVKLRIIPCPPFGDGTVQHYVPGDAWYARSGEGGVWHFWADHDRVLDDGEIAPEHRGRRPLIVVLPNGATFVTTSSTSQGAWRGPGWTITGDGESITLSPSIHFDPGGDREWHGFLTNGVLT